MLFYLDVPDLISFYVSRATIRIGLRGYVLILERGNLYIYESYLGLVGTLIEGHSFLVQSRNSSKKSKSGSSNSVFLLCLIHPTYWSHDSKQLLGFLLLLLIDFIQVNLKSEKNRKKYV